MKRFEDWYLANNIVPIHVYDDKKQKSRVYGRLKMSIYAMISHAEMKIFKDW
jgi:hypothetical protein